MGVYPTVKPVSAQGLSPQFTAVFEKGNDGEIQTPSSEHKFRPTGTQLGGNLSVTPLMISDVLTFEPATITCWCFGLNNKHLHLTVFNFSDHRNAFGLVTQKRSPVF